MVWTAEKEDRLRELHAQKLGMRAIAEGLGDGTSKNAVISKCTRLGLNANFPSGNKFHTPKSHRNNLTKLIWNGKPPPVQPKRKPPQPERRIRISTKPLRIGILKSEFFNCKWVLDDKGDDGLALVCGLPVHDRSFCEAHFNTSYMRGYNNGR